MEKKFRVNRLVYLVLENKINEPLTRPKVKSLFNEIHEYNDKEIPLLYKATLLNKLMANALHKYTISKKIMSFDVLSKRQLDEYAFTIETVFLTHVMRNQFASMLDDIAEFVKSIHLTDDKSYILLNAVNKGILILRLTNFKSTYYRNINIQLETEHRNRYDQFNYISKVLSKVDKKVFYHSGYRSALWFTWNLKLCTSDANKTFANKVHAALDLTVDTLDFKKTSFRNGQIAMLLVFRLYLGENHMQFKNIHNQINEHLEDISNKQITLEDLDKAIESLNVLGKLGKRLQRELKGETNE